MLTGEFTPLELAQEAFPTISEVALKLAVETKNRGFGKLGSLLYIIILKDVTTLSIRQATVFEAKIGASLDILEKACMWPKNAGTKGHPTLNGIAIAKRKGLVRALKIASVDVYRGLKDFFSRGHEFEALLTVLEQTQTIKDLTSEDMGLASSPDSKKDNVPGYPQHVNEALYVTLDMHTICGCSPQHLKSARLRLDSIEEHEGSQIPFEVLFPASPALTRGTPDCEIWHETMLMVSRNRPQKKKGQKPKRAPVQVEGTELSLGEFCRHLGAKIGYCIRFNLVFESADPVLRTCDLMGRPTRNVKLVQSLSLTNVLYKIGNKMTTKERFYLAYVLAKSVWQYYGSDWMRQPWTHDDIQFLEEQQSEDKSKKIASYNPYYHPKFNDEKSGNPEYCPDGILLHRYPNILALAILLIEIIQGRPYDEQNHEPYGFAKIKEYYKYAWNLTLGAALDCNVIYKEVIRKCLDGKLFKEAPFDEDNPNDGINMRRDIIYREIVFPLKHLLKLSGSSSGEETMLQVVDDGPEIKAHPYQKDYNSTCQSDSSRRSSFEYSASRVEMSPPAKPNITMSLADEDTLSERAWPNITPETRSHTPDSCISEARSSWSVERPESRDDFEIAIICAVKPEYDAVALLIDQFWDDDGDGYGRAPEDQNTYRTGRIGRYNVVLALLPGMGKANAANVASGFRSSFRGIEIALIVGICGGVPFYNGQEIILGDVIISGSIVQYDFGRRYTNKFQRKNNFSESLGRANTDVRGLLAALSTNDGSEILERRTLHHLEELQRRAQRRRKLRGKYDYPGADKDKLFESSYRHKHHTSFNCDTCNHCNADSDDTCDRAMTGAACSELLCDEKHLVHRRRLDEKLQSTELAGEIQQPYVHIGTVGSGDTVMRSSQERDRISKEDNIIAFEMEGAGVWDNLSCIIIKGVCDYCDSHKSKNWQDFASATAASAMKALLERYGRRDRSPRPWDRRAYGR
ncbi:hypothetical protein TWF102_002150 [Orbilia oligospora]|uniref:Uncharacterized protein n=1 Tax=Orbilia oligospora TaxID=2813651 RepID=A0A7C8IXP7_ORBOL|nr:hypothetical protein TWF102_002150 [Orbilia oligospora]KAF3094197.1 hypothetical protein TWF103_010596 [Orbilia oligospora]